MNKIAPKREFEPMVVTTMIEVPILTAAEKAELLASLEEARAEIDRGDCLTFTADEFRDWFDQQAEAARAKRRQKNLQS